MSYILPTKNTTTTTYDLNDLTTGTITISGGTSNLLGTPYYSIGSTGATGASNAIWTTTGTGFNGTWSASNTVDSASVQIGKEGVILKEGADIKLGNTSLRGFIDRIEQRLALLSPNPRLEAEWEELKELGDRYRELEKHITEKMKTWDILKREDSAE